MFALAAAALTGAPLISLIVLAVRGETDLWPHLAAYVIPQAIGQTAILVAGVSVIAGVIGAATAWLVTTFEFPGRRALTWLLPLPLAIPTYLAAYIYVDLFEVSGPLQSVVRALGGYARPQDYWFPSIRSLGGAIFIFGIVLYPYVYFAARAMLQTQPASFAEAARMLGARPLALLRYVTLPLARPALAVGLALVALETLNDIGASEYLGVQTLTLSVFTTWLNRSSLPGAAQIALVMLVVVVALLALERYGRRRNAYAGTSADLPPPRPRLAGTRAIAALAICLAPVTLGFLLPGGYLLRETLARGLVNGFDPDLTRHALTTIALALAATLTVLTLATGAVLLVRAAPHPLLRAAVALGALGYAIPGTVLALGLLPPVGALDAAFATIRHALGATGSSQILIGSGAALVLAYAARFLAIGTGFVQAGLTRVSADSDDAARLLGARPWTLARTVHLPLIRPALAGAGLLVFVDCLKELPASLMLRPLNVETLSTYIYQFAARGSFEDGALAALLIVAAGILPVIQIVRQTDAATGPLPTTDPP
ncbi:MAG TPA: iron ABC transporter permease [Pseudolabrys sp.]